MSALRSIIVLGLILTASGFMSDTLGDVFGPLEYKGYLVFDYPEGENPINNIVFTVESTLADNLLIVDVPAPWNHMYRDGTLTLTGGSLSPGEIVQIAVSVNKYFEEGEYPVSSVGITTAGEQSNAIGVLIVGDLVILRFLDMLADYRYPLAGLMAGLAALEIALTQRSKSESDQAESRSCEELLQECEKAKAAAQKAESAANEARKNADKAKEELGKANENLNKAKNRLDKIEQDQTNDDTSWVEADGRRITSMDLKLRSDASKELWDQYQKGEIDAQSLEKAWEELGEDSALEELRGKNKEAAEKKVKELKDQVADAEKKADEAEKHTSEAKKKAAEAREYADKVCKKAQDCLKPDDRVVIDQGMGLTSDGELIKLDTRLGELGLSQKEFRGLSKLELNTDDPPTENIYDGIRVSPRLSAEVHQLDSSPTFVPKFTDASTDIHIPLPKIGEPLKPSIEQIFNTGDSSTVNYRLYYKPKKSYDGVVLVDLQGSPLIGTCDDGIPIEFDPSHRLPAHRSIPIKGDLRLFELFRNGKGPSSETIILVDAKIIPSPE